ncbi:nuclear pore complex protein Nup50-like [Uloborus diversus]|uniref:nuclear pore complex protein Nup50-like n=1 Tax=Uloborus diversus TaxID=327109 RepID=UPI00240A19C4|nr:nuclear pore complex protein Nup50-like [Uloborus diversus]XP_054712464.1 nuclear pore complex protein Nup50-like [Uloborus diversus]
MAKRTATSELNHDNWDQEGEPEDPGTFKTLPADELKTRVFAKAKRSLGSNNSSTGSSPFALFSGFSSTASANSSPFFKKSNNDSFTFKSSSESNPLLKKENGTQPVVTQKETDESTNSSLFTKSVVENKSLDIKSNLAGKLDVNSPPTFEKKTEHSMDANQSSATSVSKGKPARSIDYFRQLQSLNESVLKWMELHFSKNACCDFTPVFNDYKKHLDTLNLTYPFRKKESSEKESGSEFKSPAEKVPEQKSNTTSKGNSSFTLTNFNKDETDYGANFSSNTTNTSTFSFGQKTIPTATSSGSTGPTSSCKVEAASLTGNCQSESAEAGKGSFPFSFGLKNAQLGNSSSANKPFSFQASAPAATAESEKETDEYVPPKNDFNAVNEEDALYSKRCKLFFKKDETYSDKGVGTLYLKPLDGKTQLLVRADTNLGNILLNIILSSSLPMSRTGKNNVLLVCVPNPPVDAKNPDSKDAIPMLIRVKTAEDADELLEMLNKYKS